MLKTKFREMYNKSPVAIAINYYHDELKKSQVVKDYLKSRGITKETTIKFHLGYAPSQCNIGQRFHDRLIIPIYDPCGEPVGWTARTLINAPAKYINVKESSKYQKGRLLFGYHLAKKAICKTGQAILVEGQFDAIRLHQEGLPNVVASSGTTSFKPAGARLLSRYASIVYIVFDGDEAGQKASLRAQVRLEELGVKVINITLSEGTDPDTFVLNNGREAFLNLLRKAYNKEMENVNG